MRHQASVDRLSEEGGDKEGPQPQSNSFDDVRILKPYLFSVLFSARDKKQENGERGIGYEHSPVLLPACGGFGSDLWSNK